MYKLNNKNVKNIIVLILGSLSPCVAVSSWIRGETLPKSTNNSRISDYRTCLVNIIYLYLFYLFIYLRLTFYVQYKHHNRNIHT